MWIYEITLWSLSVIPLKLQTIPIPIPIRILYEKIALEISFLFRYIQCHKFEKKNPLYTYSIQVLSVHCYDRKLMKILFHLQRLPESAVHSDTTMVQNSTHCTVKKYVIRNIFTIILVCIREKFIKICKWQECIFRSTSLRLFAEFIKKQLKWKKVKKEKPVRWAVSDRLKGRGNNLWKFMCLPVCAYV